MTDPITKTREDLASASRVRTRLATSTSDKDLPHVCAGLLPRVLRIMDSNWDAMLENAANKVTSSNDMNVHGADLDGDADNSTMMTDVVEESSSSTNTLLEVQTSLHQEYKSILDHSIERLLGRGYRNAAPGAGAKTSSSSSVVAPWKDSKWIDAIADYLISICKSPPVVETTDNAEDAPMLDGSPTDNARADNVRSKRPLGRPGIKFALTVLRTGLGCIYQHFSQVRNTKEGTTAINISCGSSALNALKASAIVVEYLYRQRFQLASDGGSVDEQVLALEDELSAEASWLFLDGLAILVGTRPLSLLGDYYWLCDGSASGAQLINAPSMEDIAPSLTPIVDRGVHNLLLDLVLFRPNSSCSRCGGMSTSGTKTMRHPYQKDDGMSSNIRAVDWQELKIVALKAAVGMQKNDGFFGNSNHTGDIHDREAWAISLLVLASANALDTQYQQLGRLSISLLRSRIDGARCRAQSLQSKSIKQGGPSLKRKLSPSIDQTYLVRTAIILLRLTLGDEEANVVQRNDAMLIPRLIRMPLSPRDAATVHAFVMEKLRVPNKRDVSEFMPAHYVTSSSPVVTIDRVDAETIACAELALAAATRALHLAEPDAAQRQRIVAREGWTSGDGGSGLAGSGAETLRALARWLAHTISIGTKKNEAFDRAVHACFDIAASFLRSDVLPAFEMGGAVGQATDGGERRIPQEGNNNEDRDQNEVPYRMRGRLAARERARKIRLARMLPPSQIRCCCLEVIRDLVGFVVIQLSAPSSGAQSSPVGVPCLSFDLPVLLLNCLIVDKELSSHVVSDALNEALKVYEAIVKAGTAQHQSTNADLDDMRVQRVAPLLPALLTVSTSEDYIARRIALRWSTEVLRYMDSGAAYVLCSYLAKDSDKQTSKAAQACCDSIQEEMNQSSDDKMRSPADKESKTVVFFIDSSVDVDKQVLLTRIVTLNQSLADRLGISVDSASIILRRHHFSLDEASHAVHRFGSVEEALEHCGAASRCNATHTPSQIRSPSARACGICLEDSLGVDDLFAMPCAHAFCRPCYSTYIAMAVDDGTILDSTCPQDGCNERFVYDDIRNILPEKLNRWEEILLQSYVERTKKCRWCPGIDCTMVAISDTATGQGTCTKCDSSFCFECAMRPHTPAACNDLKQFTLLLESSEYWITKHARPCPGCDAPIEKNTGCNHMTCTKCGAHFCWLCLTLIDADGVLNRHACNRYSQTEEWSEKGRNEFYLTRYEAHAQAETYAKRQLDNLIVNSSDSDGTDTTMLDLTPDDTEVLLHATKALVRCRSFLKYSFVAAWAWPLSRPKKELFEEHQATLELFTEKLSRLSEADLDVLLSSCGERYFSAHFRALSFHTLALEAYIERMVFFLDRAGVGVV